jgi:hypothetical protein
VISIWSFNNFVSYYKGKEKIGWITKQLSNLDSLAELEMVTIDAVKLICITDFERLIRIVKVRKRKISNITS